MRYLFAFVIIMACAAGGLLEYRHLTAGPAVVLPLPRQLLATTGQGQLLPGGWTNSNDVSLKASGLGNVVAGMDVELRLEGTQFTGTPTGSTPDPGQVASACTGCVNGDPVVTEHLADGYYHWQARLHNKQGVSPWRVYRGHLNVDTQPPVAPSINSSTDPNPAKTYHSSTLQFGWQTSDSGSGVDGYSYRLDADPHGLAATEVRTNSQNVSLTGISSGTFYFHLRAVDHAGNWGSNATFPVHVDVTPPGLTHVRFSAYAFNPEVDALTVSFGVTKAAQSIHVGIYRQSNNQLVRLYALQGLAQGQKTSVSWHGNDVKGQPVPPGDYEVYVRTTDQYGHSALTGWRDFVLTNDKIVVSLSQQRLVAYDNGKVFLTSLVTTGNPKLPTPAGTYHIMAKLHPFTFRSPWPKSSPFYYEPSKVQYAMLFRGGGYFIHDAPWRGAFGPGTNAQIGTPGQNFTGTHGCINVPSDVAAKLFAWAPVGTLVEVVP
jgi:hypothetical protein